MLFRRTSNRTAARLSAAIRSTVLPLIEPLENRQLLSADVRNVVGIAMQSTGKVVALDVDANNHAVLVRYLPNSTALDTSFGVGGEVTIGGLIANSDIAVGPGDKIVIAGQSSVARFNADGSLDTSFGGTGVVPLGGNDITAVAVQSDGRVLLGISNSAAVVERLNANGTTDTFFGSNGSTSIQPPPNSQYFVHDMTVESDGEIAIVGNVSTLGASAFSPFIAQFTSAGLVDSGTTFTIPVNQGSYAAVAQASDGTLVVSGTVDNVLPDGVNGLLVKYQANGQTAFVKQDPGTAGNASPLYDSLVLTPNNKIVVSGPDFTGSSGLHDGSNLYIARYDMSGNHDPTFGNGGVDFLATPLNDGGGYLAVASDNTLYVLDGATSVPQAGATGYFQPELYHLNTNGSVASVGILPPEMTLPARIEAENFDVGGEGVAYHDTDTQNIDGQYRPSEGVDIGFTNDGGVDGYAVTWTHPGEYLNYTVHNPTAGIYNFDARVASAEAGAAFHVEVDGVNVTGTIPVPDTGSWYQYTDVVKNGISIGAGDHVIRVVFDNATPSGFSGNLNWFQFTAANASGPYGGMPAAVPGTIQLENFDLGGEGVGYHDTTADNEGGAYRPNEGVDLEATTDPGGGYDVGWTHTGEYLNYTVNVASTGQYVFNTRVADYGSGARFHWEIDGANVTGSLAVPDTNGFQNWTTVASPNVTLSAGQHVLRLVIDSQSQYGYGGNYDSVQLTPVSGGDGQPFSGTPAAVPGTVQAEDYNTGGEGVAYHDTTTANQGGAYRNAEGVDIEALPNSGAAVDYTHTGEWMKYTVNVATSGTYSITSHVANYGTGGAFHIEVDGQDVTGTLAVPDTGTFTNFTDVTKTGVTLSAGQHVIRFVWDGESQYGYSGNLDWFRIA